MSARAKTLTVLAVAALLLTGARGSSSDSQPKVHNKGNTSASPSPSGPTAEKKLQTKYPDIGLDFTIPNVSGSEHEALASYIKFKRGAEIVGRERKITPLLTESASGNVISEFKNSLKRLKKEKTYFAGKRSVTVKSAGGKGSIVGFDLCTDLKEVKRVVDGKSKLGKTDGPGTLRGQVIVTLQAGKWIVTENRVLDGKC